jgi:hypothetical protein
MARPLAKINWDLVNDLLVSGCSGREIAANIGLNEKTLYYHCVKEFKETFTEYSTKKYAKGHSLLHNKQFEIAMAGNVTMLIWLGKVRMSQKEPEANVLAPANQPQIDQNHTIMQLQHRIAELEANANKPKAE